jgi:HSP20 family molecular chaperone IbpA
VDVFEDEIGITLIADLPGVTKEGLDIQLDRDAPRRKCPWGMLSGHRRKTTVWRRGVEKSFSFLDGH